MSVVFSFRTDFRRSNDSTASREIELSSRASTLKLRTPGTRVGSFPASVSHAKGCPLGGAAISQREGPLVSLPEALVSAPEGRLVRELGVGWCVYVCVMVSKLKMKRARFLELLQGRARFTWQFTNEYHQTST
jgi:hypothetical protein